MVSSTTDIDSALVYCASSLLCSCLLCLFIAPLFLLPFFEPLFIAPILNVSLYLFP